MTKSKWVWMPHSGHLIVGSECQFHLNTMVGDYIVSTVGEWWPDQEVRRIHAGIRDAAWTSTNKHLIGDPYDHAYLRRFGFMEIGAGRTYETMVFPAMPGDPAKCDACTWRVSDWSDVDSANYNDAGDAYRGHLEMCETWSTRSASVVESDHKE